MNEGMQNASEGWYNSSNHVKNMLHLIITKNMEINELIKSVMNVIHKINSQTDVSTYESQITHDDERRIQIENVQIQNHPIFDQSIEISRIIEKDTSKIMFTDGNCKNEDTEDTSIQIEDAMLTADLMEHGLPQNIEAVEEYENTSIIESKPFQCSECDKAFSHKESLKRHKVIHGDHMFQCDQCEFQTVWDISLKSHTMTMHTEKQYKCDKDNCDYMGRLKSDLKRHMGAMHEGIIIIGLYFTHIEGVV